VNGGRASQPFGVFVDANGRNEKLGGLKDDVPLLANEVVKVRTTGGGGWGNPLDRLIESVRMDVWQEKVSEQAAKDIYGVVIEKYEFGEPFVDMAATEKQRAELRASDTHANSVIDRGPGLEQLKLANEDAKMPERFA
jgi:N-methylhydantoinase B